MKEDNALTRRSFLKITGITAAAASTGLLDVHAEAAIKAGTYATLIDLTRCDGCKGEAVPRCVAACRQENTKRFPEPQGPIKDLWPQKSHDDCSKKRNVIDRLTPYNWTTVQQVQVDGETIHIPRRCMHCDNPPCANLCPFGALNKYADGSVVINDQLCMGGAKCKAVCPWSIPQRQSGVGVYLKIQPMPAGGGVMYKCDLCHERLQQGLIPACVEACATRLGEQRPLFFGKREEIVAMAHARAKEIDGHIYGERENGGTSTLYVSKVPFAAIHARLKESKSPQLMGKVTNALDEVNRWAKAFLFGPLAGVAGAVGLALYHRNRDGKGDK